MNQIMLGAIAMGSITAALFFFRFWRDTGDRLFLAFGLAFGVEAINRVLLALSVAPGEGQPIFYLVRLATFLLILAGIVDRNRRPDNR